MKHKNYFIGILLLVAAAAWVVFGGKFPTKEGLDLKGGMRVILRAAPQGQRMTPELLSDAKKVLERRVNSTGVSEPLIQTKGVDQIIVELPDIPKDKKDEALAEFQKMAMLRFVAVPDKYEVVNGEPPSFVDKTTRTPVDPSVILKEGQVIVTGKELLPGKARGNIGSDGSTVVELHFNAAGRKAFADYTLRNVKKYFAIMLDAEPISVPVVEEPIPSGDGVIRGSFSLEEAQKLADLLNAGALPVPMKVDQVTDVDPTLGKDNVQASILAGVIGLLAVVAFMILYYRLPGLVATVALSFYTLFVFALYKLIPVTLTLPGIAAFIVSIGMAVDANILIFERLKEELNGGKSLRPAVDAGFSRAFTSIFDSNMCTLITCAVLYNFGTGPIRGFAVSLAIGVLVSMFTAITCTRTMLYLLVPTSLSQKPTWWGLGTSYLHGRRLNIVGKWKLWFGLSAAIILPGLVFMGLLVQKQGSPVNKGIDFTGGSILQIRYLDKVPSTDQLKAVLAQSGRADSTIAISSAEKRVTIRGKFFPANKAARTEFENSLQAATGNFQVETFDNVGPVMGKELTGDAIKSILIACVLIVLYLAFRFTGFDFGVTAVAALFHDVLVLLGLFAILGYLAHWEVDSLFVTAALTVLGFSVHDTIVVFDRIRENLRYRQRGESFEHVADTSITQTIARSINTSMTVIMVLLAMVLFGGVTLKQFNVAMLIGIITGTYSSIFNATPLLALWRGHQRKQAQVAARRTEAPMVAKPQKPMAPAAQKPVASESAASDAEQPAAVGAAMAAKPAQRKIKKKKRR